MSENTRYGKTAGFIASDVEHLEFRETQTLVQVDKVLIRGAFKHAGLATWMFGDQSQGSMVAVHFVGVVNDSSGE